MILASRVSYPSATVKLLWVLLNPGEGELFTQVASGHGEHWNREGNKETFVKHKRHLNTGNDEFKTDMQKKCNWELC